MSPDHSQKRERRKQERLALSVREAAEALGVSRASLYRAIEDGRLIAVKIGARRLIPIAAIDALLAGVCRP
jgi:excisionase family DNA binding protein